MWTRFMDMNSGGGRKEKFARLYIEAPEAEAKVIFYNRFGHNPERVTCTCCGDDYSISEAPTLEEVTSWDRLTSRYGQPEVRTPLEDYLAAGSYDDWGTKGRFEIIYAKDIKPEERTGPVPAQGFVWVD